MNSNALKITKLTLFCFMLFTLTSCNSPDNVKKGLVIDRYEYTDATCFRSSVGLSCIPKIK